MIVLLSYDVCVHIHVELVDYPRYRVSLFSAVTVPQFVSRLTLLPLRIAIGRTRLAAE